MLAFLLLRLLLVLPVVWIVVSLVFGLIHMVPGGPVADAGRERTYMIGLLQGISVNSFRNQQTVASTIVLRYPATVEVAIASMIFSMLVSIPFGVIDGSSRGTIVEASVWKR